MQAYDSRPFRERLIELIDSPSLAWEEANDRLYRAALTDGLPVNVPTQKRIESALAFLCRSPLDALSTLTPSFVAPTIWDVVANAVMAGCEERCLPVLLEALEAVADPEFNLLGIQTTTGSAAPVLIINGPIATQLGFNAGANCLGPGTKANATVGRALRLVLQNIGGAVPGIGDMATHGQPGKYTWCFAENEAASPWAPFIADRGHEAGESTVTVAGVVGSIEVVLEGDSPADLASLLSHSMVIAGNTGADGTLGSGQALVLLPPESAGFFAAHGWGRATIQDAIFDQAHCPSSYLPARTVERIRQRYEEFGRAIDGVIPIARSPRDIFIVVAGGVGIKATVLPTWGGGTELVTRAVQAR